MPLANWIRPSASARQIAAWALEAARRSQIDVAQRLSNTIYGMSLPEAQGYIRARAAGVLEREVVRLKKATGGEPILVQAVRQQAMNEVIRMALADVMKAKRQSLPLRKAA